MKKDRNCGMNPYPVYPNYQGMPNMMMPNMMMPNMMPYNMANPMGTTTNIGNIQTQTIDNLERQINMLDRRVTKLETLVNSTSTYNSSFNDSNYHVM